jgi:hydroxymethylbilane synthase
MGGGCLVPIGAHAFVKGDAWRMDAIVAAVDGSTHVRRIANGTLTSEAELLAAAEALADDMLASGGRELVASFRAANARRS